MWTFLSYYLFVLMSTTMVEISESSECVECSSVRELWHYISFPEGDDDSNDAFFCFKPEPCTLNLTHASGRIANDEDAKCPGDLGEVDIGEAECEHEDVSVYRTMNGSCNNLFSEERHYWGRSGICHQRFLPHDYADDKSFPRQSCTGSDLPNARAVSNALHKNTGSSSEDLEIYFIEWGQVVGHDVSLTETINVPETGPDSCCNRFSARVDDKCIAIEVPDDDDFYKGKQTCLPFRRTLKCPHCPEDAVRHSYNQNTAFFDLSIVYGSDQNTSMSLRSFRNGMLSTQELRGVGSLPPAIHKSDLCTSLNHFQQCFHAGDPRIAQNMVLTALQIILLRNHNNICKELQKINPHWNDERHFQEARRINIGQAQYIAFAHYVPRVLGPKITEKFKIDVLPDNIFRYTEYNPNLDATIWAEYSSVAQRYGHTMIPNLFYERDVDTKELKIIRLKDYFNYPFDFYKGQLDGLALGMSERRCKERNPFLSSFVRNWLYHERSNALSGSDLAATSIVRGRDHGIPGYTAYLKFFFDLDVRSFSDLKQLKLIPAFVVTKMCELYTSVHDVDLYSAGLSEHKIKDALVGPTFAAIMVLQYRNMKFGDRYYFEHGDQAGSFTLDQLHEIKSKTNLARIICETTKVKKIQTDVFLPPSKSNKRVRCDELPKFDFRLWKDD